MTEPRRDFLDQDIEVEDRVLMYHKGKGSLAWGTVTRFTPKMVVVDYDTGKNGWKASGSQYKMANELIVIGDEMKQAIAIKKLSS